MGGALVFPAGARGVVDPVKGDERQAADHEDDSYDEEDGRLRREGRVCDDSAGARNAVRR